MHTYINYLLTYAYALDIHIYIQYTCMFRILCEHAHIYRDLHPGARCCQGCRRRGLRGLLQQRFRCRFWASVLSWFKCLGLRAPEFSRLFSALEVQGLGVWETSGYLSLGHLARMSRLSWQGLFGLSCCQFQVFSWNDP